MIKTFRKITTVILLLLAIVACSTEKNTLINRTYHGTTARYNGYFNANELIRQAVTSYQNSMKEDYYSLLEIEPLPDETEVIGLYPSIDTAIVKCTKVIQNHSMPRNDRPSHTKKEKNACISA